MRDSWPYRPFPSPPYIRTLPPIHTRAHPTPALNLPRAPPLHLGSLTHSVCERETFPHSTQRRRACGSMAHTGFRAAVSRRPSCTLSRRTCPHRMPRAVRAATHARPRACTHRTARGILQVAVATPRNPRLRAPLRWSPPCSSTWRGQCLGAFPKLFREFVPGTSGNRCVPAIPCPIPCYYINL